MHTHIRTGATKWPTGSLTENQKLKSKLSRQLKSDWSTNLVGQNISQDLCPLQLLRTIGVRSFSRLNFAFIFYCRLNPMSANSETAIHTQHTITETHASQI